MSETIDQQFIEYIVKALVSKPDEVKVERRIDEKGVLLELYVGAEDLGRVIGRNGGTAKSIRTLLRALGVKNDARYNLKIVDTNSGGQQVVSDPPAETQEKTAEEATTETTPPEAEADIAEETAAEETAPEEEQKNEEESSAVDRHREDLKDITDFDI